MTEPTDTAGMTVDGDVLRDVVLDAVPRYLTDETAAEIAEAVLDGAARAGMSVLHGIDGTPREAICGVRDYPGGQPCIRPLGHSLADDDRHLGRDGSTWITTSPDGSVK